jgi:hypothetical protein
MAFMKFSKGKKIYSVPNGLGDGSAYFSKTEGIIANVDNLPYGNSARTISCWVYPTQTNPFNSTMDFFSYGYPSTNNRYGLGIAKDFTSFRVFGYSNTTTYNYSVELKKWYHIVFTFDTDYTEKCYVNGVLIGTQTHSNINTLQGSATIGRTTGDDSTSWFYGNIKNVQIYNRVLSAEEVTQLYNKQEITSGRVLYVPLLYGKDNDSIFSSKSFVYDYSILTTSSGFDEFGYPIRYDMASECGINYATIPTDSLILYMALNENRTSPEIVDSDVFTTNYEGNYNSGNYQVVDNVPCLYLASSTAIGLATKSNGNIRQATLSYWGKLTDVGSCFITNSLNDNPSTWGSGSPEIWLGFTTSSVKFSNGNDQEEVIRTKKDVDKNWHHVAVTWDMDTNYMYLYFDGELVGERTDKKWLSPNFNVADYRFYVNNLYRASGNGTGNSYYSSVRMYDRVLKVSEIKALAREF